MAKRLRDKYTGEVYGWNFEMSKLHYLEEFDDDDPSQAWKGPPDDGNESNSNLLTQTVVGDNAEDVMKAALEGRAALSAKKFDATTATLDDINALTEEQINNLSEEEFNILVIRFPDQFSTDDPPTVEETPKVEEVEEAKPSKKKK
jgi:hypothetical protein